MDKNTNKLTGLRQKLGKTDKQIIKLLGQRMEISRLIGRLKLKTGMEIPQKEFWTESGKLRIKKASKYKLDKDFIENLFLLIQEESIRTQQKLFDRKNDASR